MKIIILGAGRIGESVADTLVSERNDITVIDTDAARLQQLEERLELRGVVGSGIEPDVLAEAGARDADMLIACAAQDETNLVACKIAQLETAFQRSQARAVLVDDRDVVLLGHQRGRHALADAAGPQDDDLHYAPSLRPCRNAPLSF